MNSVNLQALFTIASHLIFVYLAYSALSVVRLDVFFHAHQENKSRILKVFLAIALGYMVSSFLLAIVTNLQNVLFSY